MNKKEQVTSDTIPDVLGTIDPQELRLRKDKLLQKRLKQNKNLKSQIEEKMNIVATFTSDSASAIDKQHHLLKMMGAEISSNWHISEVQSDENGMESFTVTSNVQDQNLSNDYLDNYLMSGVKLTIVKNKDKELEQESLVNSILEMNLDVKQMASLLLKESKVQVKEQEEPDSKDAESDVIDDVQSMLVKMLPMTKGLDLSPEKEEELKKHIDAALAIFNSDKTESIRSHTWDFVSPDEIEVGNVIIVGDKDYTVGKISHDSAVGTYNINGFNYRTNKKVKRGLFKRFFKGEELGYVATGKFNSPIVQPVNYKPIKLPSSEYMPLGYKEAVDYPQFQFAILVSREDYIDAIRILNDANITPKTSFNDNDKSILAFDEVHSDDAGIAKLTKERVIKILADSGIAATGAVGLNFMSPVDKEADELDGSDDLDQEDLVARTEAILFGKRKVK